MNPPISSLLVVKEGVAARLRAARTKLGLKQPEFAAIAGISRATQANYESGQTSPSVDYLMAMQSSKVDLGFVLFDQTKEQLDRIEKSKGSVNWAILQTAHEDVEFFCMKFAPNCPASYRWKMMSELYELLLGRELENSPPDALEHIGRMWSDYGKL